MRQGDRAIDDNGPVFETAIFDEDNNVVGYEEELDQRPPTRL